MTGLTRYLRVLMVFVRNSLVRAMTFRVNFILEAISNLAWVSLNLGFNLLLLQYTHEIGAGTGWTRYPYLVFLATVQIINSMVEAFFMPNTEEFSELVRTGDLDFALLKPIDTQFLISFAKFDLSAMVNLVFAGLLLGYGLLGLDRPPSLVEILCYPLFVCCGVAIFYSLMMLLAATTVWLGRNQSIYDFWFYITNFSRYPREIYVGWPVGTPLRIAFTYVVPILVVVNVPARLLARPLDEPGWPLAAFALVATVVSLAASRWLFQRALLSYPQREQLK